MSLGTAFTSTSYDLIGRNILFTSHARTREKAVPLEWQVESCPLLQAEDSRCEYPVRSCWERDFFFRFSFYAIWEWRIETEEGNLRTLNQEREGSMGRQCIRKGGKSDETGPLSNMCVRALTGRPFFR